MKTNIYNCSRCSEDHIDIEIFELTNPITKEVIEEADGGYISVYWNIDMWTMCPTLKQPILIMVESKQNEI